MSETTQHRSLRVAIIGAGPGGLCMASRLRDAGFDDITILEKGNGVGGTWYHNRYPGCACDIPSHLYSFSFEPKVDWSRPYAPQPEIRAYFERFAEKYDLLQHCRFGAEVESAVWSDEQARWTVGVANGESGEAEIVISALGMFNDLAEPVIEGLDAFEGTRFHSARWNWDHDLSGETVGVIGSAASAVQFVPEIVKQAGQVYLFQRTANWVLPKLDDPFTDEMIAAFKADPSIPKAIRNEIFTGVNNGMTFSDPSVLAEFEAAGLGAIDIIEDPAVREKLRPQHPFGCKRPLVSNAFYPAFNRPNLELVTDGIDHIGTNEIVTLDGKHREIDTMILATGFSATSYLSAIDVRGRGGLRISDAWKDGAAAYLGMSTSGFPNLFMLYGPNTNNGSILTMLEAQVGYALRQVQRIADESLAWIDVLPEPMARFNDEVQEAISNVKVWNAGCTGYYRTPSGRVVTQWPYSMSDFATRAAAPDPELYESVPL